MSFLRNKAQREVDRKVKDFTIELFKILFQKDISIREKYQMFLLHVMGNKVWACYLLGAILALCILVFSIF